MSLYLASLWLKVCRTWSPCWSPCLCDVIIGPQSRMLCDDKMSDPSSDRLCWYSLISDSMFLLSVSCSSSSFCPEPPVNLSPVFQVRSFQKMAYRHHYESSDHSKYGRKFSCASSFVSRQTYLQINMSWFLHLTSLLVHSGRKLCARWFCSQPHPAHHQQCWDACIHSAETLQSSAGWHLTGQITWTGACIYVEACKFIRGWRLFLCVL